jgi:hypothetical protein
LELLNNSNTYQAFLFSHPTLQTAPENRSPGLCVHGLGRQTRAPKYENFPAEVIRGAEQDHIEGAERSLPV